MRIIEESGYNITGAFMTILTIDQAEKFHEVYKSIVPEYMVSRAFVTHKVQKIGLRRF